MLMFKSSHSLRPGTNRCSFIGEKRKRKLQHLQQLIKDKPNDQNEVEPSSEQHEAYARSLSADYEHSRPNSPPYALPNSDFGSINSSSTAVSDPILTSSSASFEYPAFGPNWNASLYSPHPPSNMPAWNIPPWMPNIEYTLRVPSRPDAVEYIAPTGPPVFAQAHAPSQPRELSLDANYYAFGSSFGSQSQTSGIPNVSLPTSSPYYHGLFPGPH